MNFVLCTKVLTFNPKLNKFMFIRKYLWGKILTSCEKLLKIHGKTSKRHHKPHESDRITVVVSLQDSLVSQKKVNK